MAFLMCCISFMVVYWRAKPVLEPLGVGWVELVAYGILPTAVTFILLYRSGWHREIMGVARTCSVLLLSSAILGGVLIAVGFMFCVLMFLLNAVSGGFHP